MKHSTTSIFETAFRHKYKIKTLNNSTDFLQIVKEFQPDLILIDIMMPDISGKELASQIEADVSLKNILVAFYTCTTATPHPEASLGSDKVYIYLPKTLQLSELDYTIDKLLSSR